MSVPRETEEMRTVTPRYFCPFCNGDFTPGGGTFEVCQRTSDDALVLLHSMPICDRFGSDEEPGDFLRAARMRGLREVITA